jgi:hypothetical protein
MWQVLPKFGVFKITAFILAVITTSFFIWSTEGWLGLVSFFSDGGPGELLRVITPIVLSFLGVIWFLGAIAWKLVWKLPLFGGLLNQKVCPNLNGVWQGFTESTHKDVNGNRVTTPVEMTINATFFGFRIEFRSLDEYQKSKVVQSEIYKDPRDGSFQVSYIFEAEVEDPKPTDDSKFDGAAKLKVQYFKDKDLELSGVYWTNRAWQRGMQTAGKIRLSRLNKQLSKHA